MRLQRQIAALLLLALLAASARPLLAQGVPDAVVAADYDGDHVTDPAFVRDWGGFLYWFVLPSTIGNWQITSWGVDTDLPAPGDYDGDGKADLAIYRPSTGYWYILLSSTNFTTMRTVVPLGGGGLSRSR